MERLEKTQTYLIIVLVIGVHESELVIIDGGGIVGANRSARESAFSSCLLQAFPQ